MAERQLVVRIIGDDKSLQQAFARSERKTKQFQGQLVGVGSSVKGAFALAGVGVGAASLFAAISRSVGAASDLNEQISKSRQVFGESSRDIEAWSETSARAFGLTQREALAATGTFGNLFRTVGLLPQQMAQMSQALVQLAADLASFNNASPEDVLVAIRSGLIGETEPLRRYGVLLSEARVQQVAMAQTGKENVKSLTNQEKALARYEIILRDTASAQGDFARTQGGLANQSRILRANLGDLSADVGGLLVPALTDLARTANLAADALTRLGDIDVPGGTQVSNLFLWAAGWKELGFLLDQIEGKQKRIIDDATGPQRAAAGRAAARLAAEDRETKRGRDRFSASIRGLELKLDKAGLTQSLDDDLAVLREIERRIQRQIRQEGRTFELVDQLTQVRRQILDTTTARAEDQARRTREATERIVAARKEEAERLRQLAEAQRGRRQGRQFEALGLTSEGQERTPGAGALRRRLSSLREQVKGTFLDTAKTESELDRIAKVLSGKFGKVGRDVRAAILRMLNDISSALKGDKRTGPITNFRVANFSNIADQFPSLSQDDARRLQQILSRVGAGGTTARSSTTGGVFGFEARAGGGFGTGNVIVTGPVTVVADDPDHFRRELEKRKRRGAGSRTGPRVRTQGGV